MITGLEIKLCIKLAFCVLCKLDVFFNAQFNTIYRDLFSVFKKLYFVLHEEQFNWLVRGHMPLCNK